MQQATIQSIVPQGQNIIVTTIFSDSDNPSTTQYPVNYSFSVNDTTVSIQARIQSDLDNLNGINFQISNLQTLVGMVLQTSQDSLTTIQNNITATNTASLNPVQSQQTQQSLGV